MTSSSVRQLDPRSGRGVSRAVLEFPPYIKIGGGTFSTALLRKAKYLSTGLQLRSLRLGASTQTNARLHSSSPTAVSMVSTSCSKPQNTFFFPHI